MFGSLKALSAIERNALLLFCREHRYARKFIHSRQLQCCKHKKGEIARV